MPDLRADRQRLHSRLLPQVRDRGSLDLELDPRRPPPSPFRRARPARNLSLSILKTYPRGHAAWSILKSHPTVMRPSSRTAVGMGRKPHPPMCRESTESLRAHRRGTAGPRADRRRSPPSPESQPQPRTHAHLAHDWGLSAVRFVALQPAPSTARPRSANSLEAVAPRTQRFCELSPRERIGLPDAARPCSMFADLPVRYRAGPQLELPWGSEPDASANFCSTG